MIYRTEDGKSVRACVFSTAPWVISLGENLYFTCYYGFRILFVHIIPCTALVILNLLLFRTLKLARQNRKKLFSRCTAPTNLATTTPANNKTTLNTNRSNEENLIYKTTTNEAVDELNNKKSLGKQNLRSKLSNAFTTIILSSTSLSKVPKLSTNTEEVTYTLPLTEVTLPTSNGSATNPTTYSSNNNSAYNLANNMSNLANLTNHSKPVESNEHQAHNQLIAHQITGANKALSNSSIHSYTTTSNQISSSQSSIYRMQASSLTATGQYSTTVNTTIVATSPIVCTSSDLSINSPTNNAPTNQNVNTVNAQPPSISLTTGYITKNTANSNSKPNGDQASTFLNGNLAHNSTDHLINSQDSLTKNTLTYTGSFDTKSDSKLTSTSSNNQPNLQSNRLKNYNTTEKLNLNKEQSTMDNQLSAVCTTSSSSAPISKTPSCKKLNTLECKRQRDNQCTTLMLIVVVSVFLCTEIPLAITTLLHVTQNILEIYIANYKTLNSTILFTNFFIMLSYPVNFAIYCGMSRAFRETFKTLILNRILCREHSGKAGARYTTTTNATYSNFECSRSQFRHNSVTNQLITTYPSNIIQLKSSNLSSQQASDYSSTSNNPLTEQPDESTSLNRQSRKNSSDFESSKERDANRDPVNKETINKPESYRERLYDERRIRFKTNSFELENCDLNNNRNLEDDYNVEANANQSPNDRDNDQVNGNNKHPPDDRPPYIETNL